MNKDIRNIIGKYLLPSIESVKINKSQILISIYHYTINIKFYLDNNLIPSNGITKYCNDFKFKKYKLINNTCWTIRDN